MAETTTKEDFTSTPLPHPFASSHELLPSSAESSSLSTSEHCPCSKTFSNYRAPSGPSSPESASTPTQSTVDNILRVDGCSPDLQLKNPKSDRVTAGSPNNGKATEEHQAKDGPLPLRKIKLNGIKSGSLPSLLFPWARRAQAQSPDKINQPSHCNKSVSTEIHTSEDKVGSCIVPPVSPTVSSSFNVHPANVSTKTNSPDNFLDKQCELNIFETSKVEAPKSKGLVRSLAEQFQRLQGGSPKRSSFGVNFTGIDSSEQKSSPGGQIQDSLNRLETESGPQLLVTQENKSVSTDQASTSPDSEDDSCNINGSSISHLNGHNTLSCKEVLPGDMADSVNHGKFCYKAEKKVKFGSTVHLPASVPMNQWVDSVSRYYNAQVDDTDVEHHARPSFSSNRKSVRYGLSKSSIDLRQEWKQDSDHDVSELNTLYNTSLQTCPGNRTLQWRSENARQTFGKPLLDHTSTRKMQHTAGRGLSRTPTAELERSLCGTTHSPVSKVTHGRDQSRKSEEDELYSAENFRRLARSLSGTVISGREETLVSSHSFEASNERKPLVDSSHRSHSSSSYPYTHNPSVLSYEPQHYPTQMQHPSHEVLAPSMVGEAHRPPGDPTVQKLLALPDRSESVRVTEHSDMAVSYASLPRAPKIGSNLYSTQRSSPDSWQQPGAVEHNIPIYHQWSGHPVQANGPEQNMVNSSLMGSPGRRLQNGLFQQESTSYRSYETYKLNRRPSPSTEYCTLSMPRSASLGRGDVLVKAFAPQPRIQGPRRVDMPPEEDWRQNSFSPQMSGWRQHPVYSPHRTFSSASDMYGTAGWRGTPALPRNGR